ncbi:MAG: sugar ABC transporter permease [Ignisphaera sp.]
MSRIQSLEGLLVLRRGEMGLMSRESRKAVLFLLPCLLVYVSLALIPLGYTIWLSIVNMWRPGETNIRFVGAENYVRILTDPMTMHTLRLTITYTVIAIVIEIIVGLIIGALMYESTIIKKVLTPILVIPLGIPPITVGLIWRFLLHPDFGAFTYWLRSTFGVNFNFVVNGDQAFVLTIIMDIWQWTPLVAFIVLGGLLSIPIEYVESFMVDGAGFFRRLMYLYTKMIRSNLVFAIILRFMDSFKVFDQVWMLTQGGPGVATHYVSIFLYRLGLISWNLSQAAALSLIILIIIIAVSNVITRIIRR